MATRRYGLSAGETEFQVTEAVGAAVATDSIELTVNLAGTMGATTLSNQEGKARVLQALEMLAAHIAKGNWPPA